MTSTVSCPNLPSPEGEDLVEEVILESSCGFVGYEFKRGSRRTTFFELSGGFAQHPLGVGAVHHYPAAIGCEFDLLLGRALLLSGLEDHHFDIALGRGDAEAGFINHVRFSLVCDVDSALGPVDGATGRHRRRLQSLSWDRMAQAASFTQSEAA